MINLYVAEEIAELKSPTLGEDSVSRISLTTNHLLPVST